MIRRLLTGLAGLVVLTTAVGGLPAFLIAAHRALADLMPALGDLPAALLAPGDGGLFLLTLLGIGWLSWLVFALSVLVEVVSRVRGVRAPRLGPFVPQRTAAWAVTAVTLLTALSPTGSTARTAPTVAAPAATTALPTAPEATPGEAGARLASAATQGFGQSADAAAASPTGSHVDADGVPWRHYRVKRGDTLWDIADRKLGEPTKWPTIAEASDDIRQPGGRHLEDPDLILPGWTLHIPGATKQPTASPAKDVAALGKATEPATGEPSPALEAEPPVTPLRPAKINAAGSSPGRGTSATSPRGRDLPGTPLTPSVPQPPADVPHDLDAGTRDGRSAPRTPLNTRAEDAGDQSLPSHRSTLTLPAWVKHPLTPIRFEDAPPESRSTVLAVLAVRRRATAWKVE